jgi:hypothetical protein
MNTTTKKIAFLTSLLVLLFFVLFVINQTAQVVQLATHVSPIFGTLVFWALVTLYVVLILVPVVLFLRLPRSLTPPKSDDAPEFPAYLDGLKKRLSSHELLRGMDLSGREKIENALAILDKRANEIIHKAASTVFLSTAISQNGRLDAFLVLSAQSRMVWQIARLYYQRPTLRDVTRLYANVAATAFLASELDDIDINEQVQPVLSAALGALAVSIPGLKTASSVLVSSVLTGSANAFLTLRVGIIARRYCGSLVIAEKRALRRTATAEAAKLLRSIVKQGTSRVTKAVWEASKNKAGTVFSGLADYAKETGTSLLSRLGFVEGEPSPGDPQEPGDISSDHKKIPPTRR